MTYPSISYRHVVNKVYDSGYPAFFPVSTHPTSRQHTCKTLQHTYFSRQHTSFSLQHTSE
uniref:Uncharacterized protein n=1 Tax=Myoviridae sp. ctKhy9 TaxID=2827677 RepID=A0A8S5SK89_9CAUD|nr:MAG TPA: hypothetical protein [Myoviridae sp. ctKhy9]